MAKDLVVREQRPYELTDKQVAIIANTEFVPADKRGKHDVIWASIFKGRSIGIDDFTAINEIHIVNGKPGLSAALAAGIVRGRGHLIDGGMSSTSATAHGRRADNKAEMTVKFTIEDAKAAGLAGKNVWKQYPQSLLWARAVTQLCRSLFSDCFLGGVYTPEELGADFASDDDVIDVTSSEVTDEPFVEPIPDEADDQTGGVTEPGESLPREGAVESAVDPTPGSVSPLDLLVATYGRDVVATAYREEFPKGSRGEGPLSEDEINRLADRLNTAPVSA